MHPRDYFKNVRHAVTVKSLAKYLGLDVRTVKLRARKLGLHQVSYCRPGRIRPVYKVLDKSTIERLIQSFRQNPPNLVGNKHAVKKVQHPSADQEFPPEQL